MQCTITRGLASPQGALIRHHRSTLATASTQRHHFYFHQHTLPPLPCLFCHRPAQEEEQEPVHLMVFTPLQRKHISKLVTKLGLRVVLQDAPPQACEMPASKRQFEVHRTLWVVRRCRSFKVRGGAADAAAGAAALVLLLVLLACVHSGWFACCT